MSELVEDLFGSPAPMPAPDYTADPVIDFTDHDRLRLGLNGARYDEVVEQIKTCRRCFNSWPLTCLTHSNRIVAFDEDEDW